MSQFGSIVRMRRRLIKNRLANRSSHRRASLIALILGGVAALLVGGHLAAPMLMEPPIDLATPRGLSADELPPGAAALEAAFWLSALLASVLNFRILELLFRRPDIRALQLLPIEPAALFLDRYIATCMEALVAATAASLFFVPLCWHGGAPATMASAAMLYGGLLFGATISLVVMLSATRQMIPDDGEDDHRPTLSDAYGGQGQLLLYAPALALAGVVILGLFWKLLLGEPLRLGYISDPFWIGCAIVIAIVIACFVGAYRIFVADYYAMAPRFHETDAADFSAVIDYQSSSFDTARLWEFGLSDPTSRVYRALAIDDDRRIAGGRVGYAVVLILAVIALAMVDLAALPNWVAASVPAILAATVVNPWHRLASRARRLDTPMALPVSPRDRLVATGRAAIRDYCFVAIPYAIATAAILGYFRDLGLQGLLIGVAALSAGFGIAGASSLALRFGAPISVLRWLPAVALVALTTCAIISLPLAITAGLLVAIAGPLSRIRYG